MVEIKLQLDSPEIATSIILILEEMKRAKAKHPNWPSCVVKQAAIVSEEAGELIREANLIDEGIGRINRLRLEAVETAATCLRLLELNQSE